MDEEDRARAGGERLHEPQQVRLVRVGREGVQGLDAGPDLVLEAEDLDLFRAVLEAPAERALRLIADHEDGRRVVADIIA